MPESQREGATTFHCKSTTPVIPNFAHSTAACCIPTMPSENI